MKRPSHDLEAEKKGKTGKRKRAPYTVGEINQLIDVLIQPLAEKDRSFILVDRVRARPSNDLPASQAFCGHLSLEDCRLDFGI